jgi:3-oxoadipate enol-lactonase
MRDRPDSTPLLAELDGLPTLVIVGDEDELTPPAQSRAMAEAIPGASLVVVRSAGHLTPLERPAETTDALLAFLAGLP